MVGPEPQYLVVAASSMLAAELNAGFSIKLDHSETSGAYFTQGISSSSKQGVQGYLIFDTKTGRAVSLEGYIIVDTPPRGQIVHVAQYTAQPFGLLPLVLASSRVPVAKAAKGDRAMAPTDALVKKDLRLKPETSLGSVGMYDFFILCFIANPFPFLVSREISLLLYAPDGKS